jgi:predicted nucleic acid-binding protein
VRRHIVDTGPIVALLNANDARHEWAKSTFSRIEPPLSTCESVIAEACFLTARLDGGPDKVMDLLSRKIVLVEFDLNVEQGAVRELMKRYASTPMSLADACLVRMSELDGDSTVITLDSDFVVYRRNRRQSIPLLTPR